MERQLIPPGGNNEHGEVHLVDLSCWQRHNADVKQVKPLSLGDLAALLQHIVRPS